MRLSHADFQKDQFAGMPYRYLPPMANGDQSLPLVVFLHGVGECGTDNESQLWYPFFSDESSVFGSKSLQQFPCHVVAPQAQDDNRWVDIVDWGQSVIQMASEPTLALSNVVKMLDAYSSSHNIDRNRIYLCGLSMGAFGVYELLARYPKLFAAAVGVCGGADLHSADAIAKTPLRIYHGNRDKVVPVSLSTDLAAALKTRQPSVQFIELDQVGHNAWEYAFRDPTLFPWLFNQSLAGATRD